MILLGNIILCIYFDKNLRTTPEPLFSSKEGIKMTKKIKQIFHRKSCAWLNGHNLKSSHECHSDLKISNLGFLSTLVALKWLKETDDM